MTESQAAGNHRLLDGAVVELAGCVLVVTGLLVRREFTRSPSVSDRGFEITKVGNWRRYTSGDTLAAGDGTITLVEFSDFQCPYCRDLYEQLTVLSARYPGRTTWLYRHYPIETIHPLAFTASLASECAAEQGRFSSFHDLVFRLQDSIGVLPWDTLALRAGVRDVGAWKSCLAESRYSDRVRADMAAGKDLGVRGTPTLLLNARRLPGTPPPGVLDSIIRVDLQREARH